MSEWAETNIRPDGGTNFDVAFDTAFDIFDNSPATSACNKVILFMTDGQSSVNYNSVQTKAQARGVRIMTYALGNGAEQATCKRLACENHGVRQLPYRIRVPTAPEDERYQLDARFVSRPRRVAPSPLAPSHWHNPKPCSLNSHAQRLTRPATAWRSAGCCPLCTRPARRSRSRPNLAPSLVNLAFRRTGSDSGSRRK